MQRRVTFGALSAERRKTGAECAGTARAALALGDVCVVGGDVFVRKVVEGSFGVIGGIGAVFSFWGIMVAILINKLLHLHIRKFWTPEPFARIPSETGFLRLNPI